MNSKVIVFTTAALLSTAGFAHAEITVESVVNYTDNDANNAEGVGVFNASSYDKLVVIVTGEHGFPNNTSGIYINGVTYDGVSMSAAVTRNGLPEVDNASPDQAFNHMYYLDNPFGTTGTISVDTNLSRMVVTLIGLDGTADGVGATAVSGLATKSVDLTTTSANSFVIASNGLGGTGNNGNIEGLNVNTPQSLLSAVETQSNYSGHLVGGATVTTPSTDSYSFTGGTSGSHVIAAEFLLGPPPPLLTMRVNTTSGSMTLVGDVEEANSINYYEVTSTGDSLNLSGWNSLADQDFDGNGPANGSGNGWEEAGGSGPHSLAEAYLLGDSTIGIDQEVSLGNAYYAPTNAQDVAFRYLDDRGKIYNGIVTYFSTTPGDFDEDGDVDNADTAVFIGNFGASSGATYSQGDIDWDGDIDNADTAVFIGNFGTTSASAEVGAALMSLSANSPANADLIYDSTTGNIKLDASEASGGVITVFQIENGDGTFNTANYISLSGGTFGGAFEIVNGTTIGDADFTFAGISGVTDLGELLPTGMDLAELQAYLTNAIYTGQSGSGSQSLDLVVVPEPSSLALLSLGGLLAVRRRRQLQTIQPRAVA